MRHGKIAVVLLLLALFGCDYTVEGVTSDHLPEPRPDACPEIRGWFSLTAEVRSSTGQYDIPQDLCELLLILGYRIFERIRFSRMANSRWARYS